MKQSEGVQEKAERLAKKWMRSKCWSKARRNVIRELDNFTVLSYFLEYARLIHEAGNSGSGFNHEMDEINILMQDQWGDRFVAQPKRFMKEGD